MQLACCQCKSVTLSLNKYKHGAFLICHVTVEEQSAGVVQVSVISMSLAFNLQ